MISPIGPTNEFTFPLGPTRSRQDLLAFCSVWDNSAKKAYLSKGRLIEFHVSLGPAGVKLNVKLVVPLPIHCSLDGGKISCAIAASRSKHDDRDTMW